MGAVRTYLMVLFLLPDQIGIAALALFYISMSQHLGAFGLRGAFVHFPDPDRKIRGTFYSMYFVTGASALLFVSLAAPLIGRFYPAYQALHLVIWLFAAISFIQLFNQGPESFLEKDLEFRQTAIVDVAGAVAMTIAGPTLAYLGFGVWAIAGEFAAGVIIRSFFLHAWLLKNPVLPAWDLQIVQKLWDYGKSVWAGANLTFLIDHFDDFWVGTVLGKSPLGLYDKAYEISRYPRRVIANPILSVFFPTFAHVQSDRVRLSRAFFRATSLIVRSGALLSLLILLSAPEIFRLLLPDAWQPMRLTFQLMVVYTFLDPLSLAANRLLLATGHARIVTKTRLVQVVVFIPAVILGASAAGIEGVALAADLMVLVGAVLLFRGTASVVDYSPRALWFWPVFALIAISLVMLSLEPWFFTWPDVHSLAAKLILVPLSYGLVLWLTEKQQLQTGYRIVREILLPKKIEN